MKKNSSWVASLPQMNCTSSTIRTSTLRNSSLNWPVFLVRSAWMKRFTKLLGRQVEHPGLGIALADGVPDGMHQMGLAEPDAAENVERIALRQRPVLLGDVAGGGIGEFVGLADHEVGEGVARFGVLGDLVAAAADRRPHPRHRRLVVLRGGHRRHGDDLVRPPRRRRRHEIDLDVGHLGMHRLPIGQHAVAVVAGNPVADEPGRGIEAELAGLQFAQLDLAEPGLEGLVADFLAQPVADAHPVRFKLLPARNFFHIGPRNSLLFVRCVLIIA